MRGAFTSIFISFFFFLASASKTQQFTWASQYFLTAEEFLKMVF